MTKLELAPRLLAFLCAGLAFSQTAKLRLDTVPAEDAQLRAEAVRLLERATAVSTPSWRPSQSTIAFHVLDSALGSPAGGDWRITVSAPLIRHNEITYGAYRFREVYNLGQVAVARTLPTEPIVIALVRDLLPVTVVKFDQDDIVRKIESTTLDERPARCIDFDTVSGEREESGQACVDVAEGWLLSLRLGNTTVLQSSFFALGDVWLPGRIERRTGTTAQLSIMQAVELRSEYPPGEFAFPDGAEVRPVCREFRAAYAVNTPQPDAARVSQETPEIRVHGRVAEDGRLQSVSAADTTRPDLAAEAIRLVSSWRFHPAVCDGAPVAVESDFTIRFRGR